MRVNKHQLAKLLYAYALAINNCNQCCFAETCKKHTRNISDCRKNMLEMLSIERGTAVCTSAPTGADGYIKWLGCAIDMKFIEDVPTVYKPYNLIGSTISYYVENGVCKFGGIVKQ